MEMKETRAKMNKTIRYVLENINKLDKSLAGLIFTKIGSSSLPAPDLDSGWGWLRTE